MTGILCIPMERPSDLGLALQIHDKPDAIQQEVWNLREQYITAQRMERLIALAQHYGTGLSGEADLVRLTLLLAEDFLICFRFDNDPLIGGHKKGRKPSKTFFEHLELAKEIHLLRDKGNSLSNSCRILASQKGRPWSGKKAKGLVEIYNRFERKSAEMSRKVANHPLYSIVERVIQAGGAA